MAGDSTRASSSDEHPPVIEALQQEQIGRNMLLLSIPLSIGLAAYHATDDPQKPILINLLIAIVSIGTTTIINGLAFRKVNRRLSDALELSGIAMMLLGFFLYLASNVPPNLAWLPVLCFFLSVVPTAVSAARFTPPANSESPEALPT